MERTKLNMLRTVTDKHFLMSLSRDRSTVNDTHTLGFHVLWGLSIHNDLYTVQTVYSLP